MVTLKLLLMKKAIVAASISIVVMSVLAIVSCKKEEKTPELTTITKTLVGDWHMQEFWIGSYDGMKDRAACQSDNIFSFTADKSSEDEGPNKCQEQPQVLDYGKYTLTTDSIYMENFINGDARTWQVMEFTASKFDIQWTDGKGTFLRVVLKKI